VTQDQIQSSEMAIPERRKRKAPEKFAEEQATAIQISAETTKKPKTSISKTAAPKSTPVKKAQQTKAKILSPTIQGKSNGTTPAKKKKLATKNSNPEGMAVTINNSSNSNKPDDWTDATPQQMEEDVVMATLDKKQAAKTVSPEQAGDAQGKLQAAAAEEPQPEGMVSSFTQMVAGYARGFAKGFPFF
jgi:hypothetical protein